MLLNHEQFVCAHQIDLNLDIFLAHFQYGIKCSPVAHHQTKHKRCYGSAPAKSLDRKRLRIAEIP